MTGHISGQVEAQHMATCSYTSKHCHGLSLGCYSREEAGVGVRVSHGAPVELSAQSPHGQAAEAVWNSGGRELGVRYLGTRSQPGDLFAKLESQSEPDTCRCSQVGTAAVYFGSA